MNTPTKAGIALAAVAALWAGGTAVSGSRVKTEMTQQLEDLKANGMLPVRVSKFDYNKGFLGATREVELEFGCAPQPGAQAPAPLRITWRDRIQHGPLPGFKGFGAARIDSELVLKESDMAALKKATGLDHLPLTLTTLVGFGGDTDSKLRVETLHIAPEGQDEFHLEGVEFRIRKAKDGSARYEGQIPTYRIVSKQQAMEFLMQDARFEGEGLAPNWWMTSGKGKGSMKTLSIQAPGPDGKPQTRFAMQDLAWTQDGRLDANKLYSAEMQFSGKGEGGGLKIDAVSMKASLKRVDMQAYVEFLKNAFNSSCQVQTVDARAKMDQMTQPLLKLLPANPSFALDELKVTLGGQTAEMHYSVGVQGVTADDLKAPALAMALMPKAELNVGAKLPIAFIQQVMKAAGKELPPEVLDAQIQQGMAQGILKREGDVLSAEMTFSKGVAKLNGKPVPLPGLPMVAPPEVAEEAASAP